MKNSDPLKIEKIIPDLKAKERKAALKEMASAIAPFVAVNAEDIFQAIWEREKTRPTTLEKTGVVIPHARIDGITGFTVLFARSKNGIDFQAEDGEPSHIFFMMAGPEDNPRGYLRLLARITRLCYDEGFRARLLAASAEKELAALLEDRKKNL